MSDKPMFADAKVGDRLWSVQFNWGKIHDIVNDSPNYPYPLRIIFSGGRYRSFTVDGRESALDDNPTLFWDEVKIEAPERPKTELCEACKRHSHVVELDHKIRAILEVPKEVCDLSDRLFEHVEWAWKQHCTCGI